MPLKFKTPQPFKVHHGHRATMRVDFADVRNDENAALVPLVNYWLGQPLIGFELMIAIQGDSIDNALHKIHMVSYVTDKQKVVQAEWPRVDVPHGTYAIFTTVQPKALPNERIVLRTDVMQVL